MATKITTDSTCDLPPEILRRLDITVIPLGIVKADRLYRDGIDINTADIAAHVEAGGEITTTSAVNIGDYHELFSRLSAQYDAVIHINIGSQFSCCHQNARLATADLPNVFVADSRNLSTGHGLLVLSAAEAAQRGDAPEAILRRIGEEAARVEASFVLDRLDYMSKGGRCSSITALGANLLKLHPCIEVIDGKMSVTRKYRGSMEKVIGDYIRDRLAGREDIDTRRAFLVSTATPELLSVGREELKKIGIFGEVLEAAAGCTIFCHCGPNALGVMFLRKS